MLQQYLPFTVLKLILSINPNKNWISCNSTYRLRYWNLLPIRTLSLLNLEVATVLTVYGIETNGLEDQYKYYVTLQQYLPFTVLKPSSLLQPQSSHDGCCNSTYRLRYWNAPFLLKIYLTFSASCNSTYRLRYWNFSCYHVKRL